MDEQDRTLGDSIQDDEEENLISDALEESSRRHARNAQVKIVLLWGLLPITIEPLFALTAIPGGLSSSTGAALMYNKTCLNLFNHTICDDLDDPIYTEEKDAVQRLASRWEWYRHVAYCIPALFTVAFLGHWGDVHGRKIPLIIPLVGDSLTYAGSLLNGMYIDASLLWTLPPVFLTGLSGGAMAVMMSCFSYISDVSLPENRVFRIIVADTVMYLFFGTSTFVSGYLFDHTGFVQVYSISIGIYALAIVYAVFGINEVKPRQSTIGDGGSQTMVRSCWSRFSNAVHIMVVFKKRSGHKRAHIIIAVTSILFLTLSSSLGVVYLFLKLTLDWSQTLYGYYSGYSTLFHGVCLLCLVPVLKKVFRMRDTSLMVAGCFSRIPPGILMAFSSHSWMVFLVPPSDMIGRAVLPTMRGFVSNLIEPWEQGKVFAAIAALETFGSLGSSSFYETYLYPRTLDFFPGFCFLFSSALLLIPLGMFIGLHIDVIREERRQIRLLQEDLTPPVQTLNGHAICVNEAVSQDLSSDFHVKNKH